MRVFATPPIASPNEIRPHANGTHFIPNDIPIDPTLSGQPFDPALFAEQPRIGEPQFAVLPEPDKKTFLSHLPQYSDGPQGDPFAPHNPPAYFPEEAPPTVVQHKSARKKRRVPRELQCSVCGQEEKLRTDGPEAMLTCVDCGLKGHPSCFRLEKQAGAVLSSNWQCASCKTCESCLKKDGDNRLLFCDSCDRGWHMDCLDPPLEQTPPGDWYCPQCAPPDQEPPQAGPSAEIEQQDYFASCPPGASTNREPSVASSSRSVINNSVRSRRKGKARAILTDESEAEMDVDLTPGPSRPLPRRQQRLRGKTPPEERAATMSPTQTIQLRRPRIRLSSPKPPSPKPPMIRLKLPARGKGKEREEELEESKGMFDDFLPPEDRDMTATTISAADKMRFDSSRYTAEVQLMPPPPPPPTASEEPGPSARPLRSSHHYHNTSAAMMTPGASASPAPSTPAPTSTHNGSTLRVRSIRFGEFDIQTWYDAPFPEEYMSLPDGKLWICEYCLKYIKSAFGASRHKLKCKMRHPPGDEIYRDGSIAIFEVDGRKNKIYCQNLCLLSKMFLDHKSLFYDVEPFLFYVITDVDDGGARFVGYFSKEKRSPKDYNVSCIMTLPVRQRQGWGNLLIDFSYLLSKKERRTGSPEKPLSALGALGYKSYWTLALMRYLRTAPDNPRLEDICRATSMTIEDIYYTLLQQHMIHTRETVSSPRPVPGQSIKFVKGRKSGVARKALHRTTTYDDERVKGPFVPPTAYEIAWSTDVVEQYLAKWQSKGYLTLKPENLKWSPFLVARTMKSEGLLDDDGGLPSATTETVTPTTPGFSTGTGRQTGNSASSTHDSPSLFEDDAGASDVLPVLSSHDGLVESPISPGQSDIKTPMRRLTRRQTSGTLPTPRPALPPASLRRTRSAVKLTTALHDAMLAEDAALAAKLAMEEGRTRRQLRSRSNTEQDKRALSPQTLPRKRRRVESPSPPSRNTRSQGSVSVPRRAANSRRPSVRSIPTPSRRPKPGRRSSRLAHEPAAFGLAEPTAEARSSPLPSPSPDPSAFDLEHEEGEDREQAGSDVDADADADAEAEADEDGMFVVAAELVQDQDQDAQPKDEEDRDTPLTGMTSGHSVGQSEDTVCAAEDHHPNGKAKRVPTPAPIALLVTSAAPVTQRKSSGTHPKGPGIEANEGSDEDAEGEVYAESDADADGEPDAEGELDAEGEEDIDAEGEPDLGEGEDDEIQVDEP